MFKFGGLAFLVGSTNALFFPGLTPKEFKQNDVLILLVGDLKSDTAGFAFDFYKLHWCESLLGRKWSEDTIGVSMEGVNLQPSPYRYPFEEIQKEPKIDHYAVCDKNYSMSEIQQFSTFAQHGYKYRLFLDNLPAAVRNPNTDEVSF